MSNPFDKYLGPEDHLQIQVLQYLKLQYPKVLWQHPPNEGKRSLFERYKAKKMGLTSGWPDILIFKPTWTSGRSNPPRLKSCGLAIELKVKPNKISKNQKETLIRLEGAGWDTHVCYTFEEAKTVIDNYLGGRS